MEQGGAKGVRGLAGLGGLGQQGSIHHSHQVGKVEVDSLSSLIQRPDFNHQQSQAQVAGARLPVCVSPALLQSGEGEGASNVSSPEVDGWPRRLVGRRWKAIDLCLSEPGDI